MGLSGKNNSTLLGDLELLIAELCTDWGFCNQLMAKDLLQGDQRVTASDFADAVLHAEGMNPEHEPNWRRRISRRFADRYGSSISSAEYTHLKSN